MTEKPEAPAQAATSAPADETAPAASPYAPSADEPGTPEAEAAPAPADQAAAPADVADSAPPAPAADEPATAVDAGAPAASSGDWFTPGTSAAGSAPASSTWAEPEPAAEQPPVPPAWNPEQSTAFGSAHVPEADLADAEEQAPATGETSPQTEQPSESSGQMGLTYDQAQHEMLKGMTPEQRIAHFQQETPEQQAAVDTWHRQQFGVPTQSNPKF